MVKMIALRPFPYGGRILKKDSPFDAPPQHAKALKAARRAVYAADAIPAAPVETKDDTVKAVVAKAVAKAAAAPAPVVPEAQAVAVVPEAEAAPEAAAMSTEDAAPVVEPKRGRGRGRYARRDMRADAS